MSYTGASPAGGAMTPRIFVFAPPDFFLAPHGIFLGGRSWCFWAEKTLKFAISVIICDTFFFGDHLFLVGKFMISARKSLRLSAKTFAPLIIILLPQSREAGDAPGAI